MYLNRGRSASMKGYTDIPDVVVTGQDDGAGDLSQLNA
jgi:hypothetical protein